MDTSQLASIRHRKCLADVIILDTIPASQRLRELRLMNDMADMRQAHRANEFTDLEKTESNQKIVDNFTCTHANNILRNAVESARLHFEIEHWVYEPVS